MVSSKKGQWPLERLQNLGNKSITHWLQHLNTVCFVAFSDQTIVSFCFHDYFQFLLPFGSIILLPVWSMQNLVWCTRKREVGGRCLASLHECESDSLGVTSFSELGTLG